MPSVAPKKRGKQSKGRPLDLSVLMKKAELSARDVELFWKFAEKRNAEAERNGKRMVRSMMTPGSVPMKELRRAVLVEYLNEKKRA